MKATKLGWLVSAGLAGLLVGAGFQATTPKFGVVDFDAAFAGSKLKDTDQNLLKAYVASRQDALNFVQLNPTFTQAQFDKYRELVSKEKLTPADQTDLDKVKSDVQAAMQRFDALRQKASPSAAEKTELDDLGSRNQLGTSGQQQLSADFQQQLVDYKAKLATDAHDKVRKIVDDMAKKQGYTVVFSDQAAVAGSMDLTTAVQKELDK